MDLVLNAMDSVPHRITRGRSPIPRGRLAHSREPSPPPCSITIDDRADSPELIFPMSPVSSDSKDSSFTLPIHNAQLPPRIPHPILDLKLPDSVLKRNQRHKENIISVPKLELPRRRKADPLAPVDSNTKQGRSSSKASSVSPLLSRRLASFLRPSVPAVPAIATPTAVTVRRSSQDGTSSLVMEEYVAAPRLANESLLPAQPIEIAAPRPNGLVGGALPARCIPHPALVTGRGGREHNVDCSAKLRKKASFHHLARGRAFRKSLSQQDGASKMALLFLKAKPDPKVHEQSNADRTKVSES